MRRFVIHCATIGILVGSMSNIVWAGSTGRRNTAIATTAVAVGAWSNGTGRAGRRNTAILATGAAAVAWGRYADKKKQESRRSPSRVVVYKVKERPVVHRQVVYRDRPVVHREVVHVPAKCCKLKKHGHGHHKHHCRGHKHHDDD